MNRDQTIDIIKGIGIILMVVGHSGSPDYVHDYIYTFHMPLFFIASGWFFSERNLDDCRGFAVRKIKNIYLPYLKWCFVFLFLHNVFYSVGIINDIYGFNGKANNWLEVKDMALHAADFSIRMTGYDGMLGAYWFIRSLLWGSLLLCFFSALIKKTTKLRQSTCIISVSIVFCIMGGGNFSL